MKLSQKTKDKSKDGFKIKCLEIAMVKVESDISDIEKTIRRMRNAVDAHINRQYTEIRVIEKDGEWGDYSGIFYVNDEDERTVIIKKAKDHFARYFQDGLNHQRKKLGLFLFSPRSGKRLLEEIPTSIENKEMNNVLHKTEELG